MKSLLNYITYTLKVGDPFPDDHVFTIGQVITWSYNPYVFVGYFNRHDQKKSVATWNGPRRDDFGWFSSDCSTRPEWRYGGFKFLSAETLEKSNEYISRMTR